MQSANCKNSVAIQETVSNAVKQSEKSATKTCNGSSYVDSETQTELFDVIPGKTLLQKLVQSLQTSIQGGRTNKHMLDSATHFFIEIKDVLQSLKTQNSLKANTCMNLRATPRLNMVINYVKQF